MALIKLAGSRKIERRGTEFELSVSALSWGRECEPWRQMTKKQVDSNVDAPRLCSLWGICAGEAGGWRRQGLGGQHCWREGLGLRAEMSQRTIPPGMGCDGVAVVVVLWSSNKCPTL